MTGDFWDAEDARLGGVVAFRPAGVPQFLLLLVAEVPGQERLDIGWNLAPGGRALLEVPRHGTDQRLGVSFDQQDGSAVGGWTEYGVIGAYAHTARHAVKCAEWCRTQDVAWRSSPRTGRAGFRLR